MDKFDIRYSISQNRIIIPHRDVHGRLVGVRCRVLNEWEVENLGKYMPVQIENIWYMVYQYYKKQNEWNERLQKDFSLFL